MSLRPSDIETRRVMGTWFAWDRAIGPHACGFGRTKREAVAMSHRRVRKGIPFERLKAREEVS